MLDTEEKRLEILEREIRVKERDLNFRIQESPKSAWRSPLVVAIFAAAVGALGNACITYYSSFLDRRAAAAEHEREVFLAASAAERDRILEMIKIGDPDQVERNLQFLIDTELVRDASTVTSIRTYYRGRQPGTGPGASQSGTVSFDELGVNRLEINGDLRAPSATFLEETFGRPREVITDRCQPITNEDLRSKIMTARVGNVLVTLLHPAVRSLENIVSEITKHHPSVSIKMNSAGALCVRKVRGSNQISSHSWGTAIDIRLSRETDTIGDEQVDIELYRIALIFIENGWVWGGGFAREESMHFEVSEKEIRRWISEDRL